MVARRLGMPVSVVVAASVELWGRSLIDERDDRARERGRRGTTSSTGRALRGHVTRALMDELRAALHGYAPTIAEGDDPSSGAGAGPGCNSRSVSS